LSALPARVVSDIITRMSSGKMDGLEPEFPPWLAVNIVVRDGETTGNFVHVIKPFRAEVAALVGPEMRVSNDLTASPEMKRSYMFVFYLGWSSEARLTARDLESWRQIEALARSRADSGAWEKWVDRVAISQYTFRSLDAFGGLELLPSMATHKHFLSGAVSDYQCLSATRPPKNRALFALATSVLVLSEGYGLSMPQVRTVLGNFTRVLNEREDWEPAGSALSKEDRAAFRGLLDGMRPCFGEKGLRFEELDEFLEPGGSRILVDLARDLAEQRARHRFSLDLGNEKLVTLVCKRQIHQTWRTLGIFTERESLVTEWFSES
jgi:hypothetical protein